MLELIAARLLFIMWKHEKCKLYNGQLTWTLTLIYWRERLLSYLRHCIFTVQYKYSG